MPSNFDYLKAEWPSFFAHVREAEQSVHTAPRTSAFYSRLTLEAVIDWLYDHDLNLHRPYQSTLSNLLQQHEFQHLPQMSRLIQDLHTIRKAGNAAAHSNRAPIVSGQALLVLRKLSRFLVWFASNYNQADVDIPEFDRELIPQKGTGEKSARELQQLQRDFEKHLKDLQDARAKLEESESEKALLKAQLEEIQQRKASREEPELPPLDPSEAETRKFLIDLQLAEAGWDLDAPHVKEYEVDGMPFSTNRTGKGFVDYVLWGKDGLPLAVVEAKKTTVSPKKGQRQAELYGNCLEKKFGRRPVLFFTNGYEITLWDDKSYPPRPMQGYYTRDELELIMYRRQHARDLRRQLPNKQIAGRYYQTQAMKRIAEDYEQKRREALLVMATGTGKTRTAVATVDLMMKADWVRKVLFLADRNALVSQAKKAFKVHLPEAPGVDLTREKEEVKSRLVFSTYPTMMNRIDAGQTDDNTYFGPGHFDLIVIDEAHRSVYQKYGAIFDYFDALLLGLTATPRDEIDRNTYNLFKRPDNDPTFAYELDVAVKDKFLVPYYGLNVPTKFLREGVKYHELNDKEKLAYEEMFRDEETGNIPDEVDSSKLNQWLFNSDTVDKVLGFLMENGLKVEGGDKLGKTIIFAKNHRHAEFIEERFNLHYPQHRGGFLKIIDNYDPYAQSTLEDFTEPKKMPQIAVSVDMLDTGIDVPEIVNLVLFKRVYSKSKFWQMLGRGTRLCPDLFGPDQDKECFYVFDFCDNFTFFNENPNGREPGRQESIAQKTFKARLELAALLRADEYQEPAYQALRKDLLDQLFVAVSQLKQESFLVKPKLKYIHQYADRAQWDLLNLEDRQDIVEHLSPLVEVGEKDEFARRFDLLMLRLSLALMKDQASQKAYIEKVQATAKQLSEIAHLPVVKARIATIRALRSNDYWESAGILEVEKVREDLRSLIRLIEREKQKIYYSAFEDEMSEMEEVELPYASTVSEGYKDRVERYVRQHADHLTIRKLHTNLPITSIELAELERILFDGNERGTKDDFVQEYGSEKPLGAFIRSILGLDVAAAKAAFGIFLEKGNLNANQITFINTIIDYLTQEGEIDKKLLFEQPFTNMHDQGVFGVFQEEDAKRIISIIDEINGNARVG